MAFKQPRVPEYRESDGAGRYLHTLVLFLKDFCSDVWVASRQSGRDIESVKDGIEYPVTSVNGKTGEVTLDAQDVGALAAGGTAADSSKLGGKLPAYYATAEEAGQLKEGIAAKQDAGDYAAASDVQSIMDTLYARSGTTYKREYNTPYAAMLTSSKTSIRIGIPVPFVLNTNTTVTITRLVGGIRHVSGGYVSDGTTASDSSNWLSGTAVSSVTGYLRSGMLVIYIVFSSALETPANNTPLTASVSFSFTV